MNLNDYLSSDNDASDQRLTFQTISRHNILQRMLKGTVGLHKSFDSEDGRPIGWDYVK